MNWKIFLRRVLVFIGVMAGIFLLGFCVGNYIVMPIFTRRWSKITVPDVCGISYDEALSTLKDFKLVGALDMKRFSEEVPKGFVLSQRPIPGRVVKSGRRVFLSVSKGYEKVKVPYLEGFTVPQAWNILQHSDFIKGNITYHYSPTVKENCIITTVPSPDSLVQRGIRVSLIVSKGKRRFSMPDLAGMSLEEAKQIVEGMNMNIGNVKGTASPTARVIVQYPEAGAEVSISDTVNLILGEK